MTRFLTILTTMGIALNTQAQTQNSTDDFNETPTSEKLENFLEQKYDRRKDEIEQHFLLKNTAEIKSAIYRLNPYLPALLTEIGPSYLNIADDTGWQTFSTKNIKHIWNKRLYALRRLQVEYAATDWRTKQTYNCLNEITFHSHEFEYTKSPSSETKPAKASFFNFLNRKMKEQRPEPMEDEEYFKAYSNNAAQVKFAPGVEMEVRCLSSDGKNRMDFANLRDTLSNLAPQPQNFSKLNW